MQLRRSALTDILKDNEGGRPLQTTNQQDLLDWSNMPAAEVRWPWSHSTPTVTETGRLGALTRRAVVLGLQRDQTRVLAVELKNVLSRSSNPISQMNSDQVRTVAEHIEQCPA